MQNQPDGQSLKHVADVFGMSNVILPDSYVDRGALDAAMGRLLKRRVHVAIRGASKSGKSWLRQKLIPEALTVQCRLGYEVVDVYRDALSQLDIKFVVEEASKGSFKGVVEATGTVGSELMLKIGGKLGAELNSEESKKLIGVGKDINDIRFIAQLLMASGRRLVIEDVHYMSTESREDLAFDLKALWDYGCFVVLVGVWGDANMFIHLNTDLAGRVEELTIDWQPDDLRKIMEKGGSALGLDFSRALQNQIIIDSFGNAGLLQRLVLRTLEEAEIEHEVHPAVVFDRQDCYTTAAMAVADQLNGVYQRFSERVASGIRTRNDATGIYAHTLAVIIEESSDADHMSGIPADHIYQKAVKRQHRIQKSNLKAILRKIDGLQCDEHGRGLVVTYENNDEKVLNVDRQLLFYRKYVTVKWPWEELIAESDAAHSKG
jgi:hypothetical protein